ncbi:hypothetical protein [Puia sp.]|jgi:hypothetical protein|uniref:hypothetical protein n=1 Tax=Puia sp. TaxID=2045100 RepID=UPI002F3E9786
MIYKRPPLTFDEWTAVSKQATFIEFDWIGIDNQGKIGVFSSVTVGYIPSKVFYSYESYVVLESVFGDLPKITVAKLATKESGRKDYWVNWAQKGLFAFDNEDVHRNQRLDRYDLIAVPEKALLFDGVPEIGACEDIIPRFNLAFTGDISFSQLKETGL